MTSPQHSLHLLQARSKLRGLLPIRPKDENGFVPFNYYSLEGYLFAIHASPLELNENIWGYELDRLLPDPCYEDQNHVDDILTLYDDMEDALELNQYFRIHTLQIPNVIPSSEFFQHPLWYWITGYMRGFFVVQSAINRLPKKIRKKTGFRTFYDEYERDITTCLTMFPAVLRIEKQMALPKHQDGDVVSEDATPFSELFQLMITGICSTAMLATRRLKKLL